MALRRRFAIPLSLLAGAALALVPITAAQAAGDQTVTDLDTLTATDLAESLVGSGVTISNVTYTGSPLGAGTFSGFDALGIDSGVVLSTGAVETRDGNTSSIIGPNEDEGTSTNLGMPGDDDLDAIIAADTYDATVLEFDFVPTGDNIAFTYVFGSDEYNEFVGSFNDVFAFFVNGENCALVPGDDGPAPVSINTINKDVNASLYKNNDLASGAPVDTELDGFTVPLVCASAVESGETNHLKLAIADALDHGLDTAVLIKAGSVKVNMPPVASDLTVDTLVDEPVDVTLVGTDPDGDAITDYTVETEPTSGTLSGTGADLTYTPDDGFIGTDSFTYTVSDGALVSQPATVTITVAEEAVVVPPTEEPVPSAETVPPAETVPTLAATGVSGTGPLAGLAIMLGLLGAGLAVVGFGRKPAQQR